MKFLGTKRNIVIITLVGFLGFISLLVIVWRQINSYSLDDFGVKYDSVEDTKEFQAILPELEVKLESMLRNEPREMGFCYKYWGAKKDVLKNDYGIKWRSPAEMNPDIIFD